MILVYLFFPEDQNYLITDFYSLYSLVVTIPECLFSPQPLTKKKKYHYTNKCMKHMRKSDPYLVIEVEGKACWKKEFIQFNSFWPKLITIGFSQLTPMDYGSSIH